MFDEIGQKQTNWYHQLVWLDRYHPQPGFDFHAAFYFEGDRMQWYLKFIAQEKLFADRRSNSICASERSYSGL